jgi:prepilin-type N-terminal cleavage/methylation domain-containing protein
MSRLPASKRGAEAGFTLIEVMAAVFILTVGVVSVAALAGGMLASGQQSKYMTLAASLASEKLEDLNRWNDEAPQICVPSANSSVGSLTSDVLQTTTCPTGASASISYYDDVSITLVSGTDCPGATAGCFADTVSSQSGGTTQYTTTYHSPDGTIPGPSGAPVTSTTAPSSVSFHRRWIIEANSPANGVRRVTVQVHVVAPTVKPMANFRMSMVRP